MTSISGISAGSTARAGGPPPAPPRGADPMAGVAKTLGLSRSELRTQLDAGQSLDDVATAQGVSHDDLISAIKAGLPAGAASGVDATAFAEGVAGRTGPPPPPPGGGPGGPAGAGGGRIGAVGDESKLDQLADLLEMDTEDLVDRVSSGADLLALLREKGVDLGALRPILAGQGDLVDVAA
ncbi:hypothetical protein GCM10010123_16350 [Pilimelia anulata]|uniref:Uncharacterized protein n=1 Tax=Pilimelia anulata TaxID=53371 RepID=A0A8J3B478_9ACTN|nr:hypothetical protein [Pilimelia anulata]GGJ87483.1 hypothetical protein GCM10010123_16350 [Pilimelia anulata]